MDLSEWFSKQLDTSAEAFIWAVDQVPVERRFVAPPAGLGEWHVARHVFHMLNYEQAIVVPSMKQWLGIPFTFNEEEDDEDAAWGDGKDLEKLLADFRIVRAEQITLLPRFHEDLWHETRDAVWSNVTLKWVVTKTFQHTAEHTHDVLRIALFWDMFEQDNQA